MDNYQSFLPRVTMDGIMITGVRAAESIQRLQYMAALNMGAKGITNTNTIYPIYDWKTTDVWLYLRDQHVDIPEVYLQMYQVGVNRNQLRVSQFFSVDTVPVLVHLGEYDPQLMERVLRREPNAYLAVMYWDSEMFHRTTKKRRELEGEDKKDYRALLKEMLFLRPGDFFNTPHKQDVARQYRKLFIRMDGMARPRDYKKMYGGLVAGDPKLRTLRAIYQDISCAYAAYAKNFRKGGEANGGRGFVRPAVLPAMGKPGRAQAQ